TETAVTEEAPKPKRTRTKKPTETAVTEEAPKPKRTRTKKPTANKPLVHRDVVTAAEAAEINDEEAKSAVKRERVAPRRRDGLRSIVNVDTLSQNFPSGGEVTLAALTEKKLVPQGTTYVKVLARGMLDKPLRVHADDFSLDAVKMIVVTGGQAITPERSGGSEA
ncbi:MAG TPA: uL15 family ribosomal protein, partial [Firmicutes bacterium]|nr:uL15 family ribosomal protein [Bacillota bacterium]